MNYTTAAPFGSTHAGLSTAGFAVYQAGSGALVLARSTANVAELGGLGFYTAPFAATAVPPFLVVWDTGGGSPAYLLDRVTFEDNAVPGDVHLAAGSTTTATLPTAAYAVTDYYKDWSIRAVAGAGAGQVAKVVGYNASTGVAALDRTLATAWDATTSCQLEPPTVATVADKTGFALADKTGFSLAAAGLDAVMAESGVNLRQAMSLLLAVDCGTTSVTTDGLVTYRAAGGSATRVVGTASITGARSAITLTPPS